MFRLLVCLLGISSVLWGVPVATLAAPTPTCTLDGFLVATVAAPTANGTSTNQQLTLPVTITNSSPTQRYSGVAVGVGLYDSPTSAVPRFWAPLATDESFPAGVERTYEFAVQMQHVPAGDYTARVTVAQGDQLATLAGVSAAAVPVTKATPAAVYPMEVAMSDPSPQPGQTVTHTLTTTNNSDVVWRDYTQHLAVVRGAHTLGTAVLDTTDTTVKIIPGQTEITTNHWRVPTPGEYTLYAYSAQPGVLLPVAAKTITVGDDPQMTPVVYLAAVGVAGLADRSTDSVTVTACVTAVDTLVSDAVVLSQHITAGDATLALERERVFAGQGLVTRVAKTALATSQVTSTLHRTAPNSATTTKQLPAVGAPVQTITQALACARDCQPIVLETLQDFAAENVTQTSFAFYGGMLAALLVLLGVGVWMRPRSAAQSSEPMHQPEE